MRFLYALILAALLVASANADTFTFKSPAFADKERIPNLFTCNGKNVSPPFEWKNAPKNTRSFVLLVYCPDPVIRDLFYNWIVYNIPSTTNSLSQGAKNLPDGAMIGVNTFDDQSYYGPCPPDEFLHHYIFELYALDTMLTLPAGADIDDIFDAMNNHILDQSRFTGVFSH